MYWKGERMERLVPYLLGFFALSGILHCYLIGLYLTILVFQSCKSRLIYG